MTSPYDIERTGGKIYALTNQDTEDIYIGSTMDNHIGRRFYHHKQRGTGSSAHCYGNIFTTPNVRMTIIHHMDNPTTDELRSAEQKFIDILPGVINRKRAVSVKRQRKVSFFK